MPPQGRERHTHVGQRLRIAGIELEPLRMAGERLVKPLHLGQNHALVTERLGIGRVDLQRPIHAVKRLLQIAEPLARQPQIQPAIRGLFVDRQHLLRDFACLGGTPLADQAGRQVDQCRHPVWHQGERSTETTLRFKRAALLELTQPVKEKCLGFFEFLHSRT